MKKGILLFLALLLPGCIFLFLRIFGKNEFRVEPLFQNDKVKIERTDCGAITFPYKISSDVTREIISPTDSLAIVCFDNPDGDPIFPKLEDELKSEPVRFTVVHPGSEPRSGWYRCVFLMTRPFNVALVDHEGTIRGQYNTADRDEIDRLKTEITIILKKF